MALFGYKAEEADPGEERLKGWEALKAQMPGNTWGGLGLVLGLNMLANNRGQNIGSQIGNAGLATLNAWDGWNAMKKQEAEKAAELERKAERQAIEDERWEKKFTREGEQSDRDYALRVAQFQDEQRARQQANARAWAGISAQRAAAAKAEQDAEKKAEWDKTHRIVDGVVYEQDPETGKYVVSQTENAFDEHGNILGAKQPEQAKFTDVNALGKRYVAESENYTDRGQFLENLYIGAKQNSAAGDLSMIFSYMKMLDPTSVVREGEQASAQNAAGVPERIRNAYNNLLTGQRLSPQQRREFLTVAGEMFDAEVPRQALRNDYYRGLSEAYGYDPSWVMPRDPYAGLSGKVKDYLSQYGVDGSDGSHAADGTAYPYTPSGRAQPPAAHPQAPAPVIPQQPVLPAAHAPAMPAQPAPQGAPQQPEAGGVTFVPMGNGRIKVVVNGKGSDANKNGAIRKVPKGKR